MDKETINELVENSKSIIVDTDQIRSEINEIGTNEFSVIFMNLFTLLKSQIKINLELFEEAVKNSDLSKQEKLSALKKVFELRKELRKRL